MEIRTFDEYLDMWNCLPKDEHFAIGFHFYLCKGPEFRRRMKSSSKLRRVYKYFKKEIFEGEEYLEMTQEEQYQAMRDLVKNNRRFRRIRGIEKALESLIKMAEAYKSN